MVANIPMMAGNVIGNVVTQYLGLVANESQRGRNYLEALKAVKAGTLNPADINLRPEATLEIPQMVGDLLRQIIQGYLPMITEENAKARKYHAFLDQIHKGSLDPSTLAVNDDGVDIVPPMPAEEDIPELEPEE